MKKVINDRPVRCMICNEPMYYQGDERWVPEYTVDSFDSTDREDYDRSYVHKRCWHKLILKLKEGGIA